MKNAITIGAIVLVLVLSFASAFEKSEFLSKTETKVYPTNAYTWYKVCNPSALDYNIASTEDFGVKFTEVKNKLSSYKFTMLKTTPIEIPDYEIICSPYENIIPANETSPERKESVENCTRVQTGTHTEYSREWVGFDPAGKSFTSNKCYDIKVEGTYPLDISGVAIDNVIEYAGLSFDEYDWWNLTYFLDNYTSTSFTNTSASTAYISTSGNGYVKQNYTTSLAGVASNKWGDYFDGAGETAGAYPANWTNYDGTPVVTINTTNVLSGPNSMYIASSGTTWATTRIKNAPTLGTNVTVEFDLWIDLNQATGCSASTNTIALFSIGAVGGGEEMPALHVCNDGNLYDDQTGTPHSTGCQIKDEQWTHFIFEGNSTSSGYYALKIGNSTSCFTSRWCGSGNCGSPINMTRFGARRGNKSIDNFQMNYMWETPVSYSNSTYYSKGLNSSKNIDKATLNCNISTQQTSTSLTGCRMKTGSNPWQACTFGQNLDLTDGYNLYYSLNLTTQNTANKIEVDWCGLQVNEASTTETEGDNAIERAINSSLTSPSKYQNQQVYVRSLDNSQDNGRFDWFVVKDSKRWAINYVTTNDPTSDYTNMFNITPVFYVLELEDMTEGSITDAVGDMINNTKG